VAPVADLDEYYCIAVEHDQIKLAAATGPVALEQAKPFAAEVVQRKAFGRASAALAITHY
jgi:hypothetical protein